MIFLYIPMKKPPFKKGVKFFSKKMLLKEFL